MDKLEQNIAYQFKDRELLIQALTHSSYSYEHNSLENYERLEFLGDAVLELVVSDILFKQCPHLTEGDLTKKRASIVCEQSLASVAEKYGIGEFLRLGHGEESAGGRKKNSILCDAVEAIIGAVYLDGGITSARKLIKLLIHDLIQSNYCTIVRNDYKSHLQEVLQRDSSAPIVYELIDENGPAHSKTFFSRVLHKNKVLGEGSGKTKKESEQMAALSALKRLG